MTGDEPVWASTEGDLEDDDEVYDAFGLSDVEAKGRMSPFAHIPKCNRSATIPGLPYISGQIPSTLRLYLAETFPED